MIMVTSRFKVGNGMEQEVRDAFLNRPRLVEEAAGFLGMDVYTDVADPSVFQLVTRWTDMEMFKAWHGSQAHHRSHRGIPKGLKLASGFTEVRWFEQLPTLSETDYPRSLVANSIPLVSQLLSDSRYIHLLVADRQGTILHCNRALAQILKTTESQIVGTPIENQLTQEDANALRERITGPQGCPAERLLLNFVDADMSPVTLCCLLQVQPDCLVLMGEAPRSENETAAAEMMHLNNELAVLSRENARKNKDLEQARAELAKTLEELKSSHWHIKKLQELLPICMECGKVKPGGQWENVVEFLKKNTRFLSHGYCPDCLARIMAQYNFSPKE